MEETKDDLRNMNNRTEHGQKRPASDIENQDIVPAPKAKKVTDGSDIHSINCSICLKEITTETIGKPDICNHQFCLACILQWSKTNNSCPVDREKFKKIFFTNASHGKYEGHFTVADVNTIEEEDEDPLTNVCRICAQRLEDDSFVGCSTCRRRVHQACIEGNQDPQENWRCSECLVFQGSVEVLTEIQTREQNSTEDERLSVEEREDIDAYLSAVSSFVQAADRRLMIQGEVENVGRLAEQVKERFEVSEELLAALETRVEEIVTYSRIELYSEIDPIYFKLAFEDKLDAMEGKDDALDEYIKHAEAALEFIEQQIASMSDTEEDDEKVDHVNGILEKALLTKGDVVELRIDDDEDGDTEPNEI